MTINSQVEIVEEEINSCLSERSGCVIGICGLGGCGKTTLAHAVAKQREGAQVFATDWYISYSSAYRRSIVTKALESRDEKTLSFWADPTNWYDWPRLLADLVTLSNGGSVYLNNAWCQKTGECDLAVDISAPSLNSALIVDGIYILHPEIRSLIDRVVFLDIAPLIANNRTESRDKMRVDESYLAFKRSVVDSFDLPYIEKYRSFIDRVIS